LDDSKGNVNRYSVASCETVGGSGLSGAAAFAPNALRTTFRLTPPPPFDALLGFSQTQLLFFYHYSFSVFVKNPFLFDK
jgi:hypothetical protein